MPLTLRWCSTNQHYDTEMRLCNLLATNDEQDVYIDSRLSKASHNTS
jgi:hypothetical protein